MARTRASNAFPRLASVFPAEKTTEPGVRQAPGRHRTDCFCCHFSDAIQPAPATRDALQISVFDVPVLDLDHGRVLAVGNSQESTAYFWPVLVSVSTAVQCGQYFTGLS